METIQVPLQQLELLQAACAGAGAARRNAEKTGVFLTVWVSQAHFGIWIVGLLLGVLIKQFLVFGLILNLRNVVPFSTVPIAQFPLAVHLSDRGIPRKLNCAMKNTCSHSRLPQGHIPVVLRAGAEGAAGLYRDKRIYVPSGKFLGACKGEWRKEKQD